MKKSHLRSWALVATVAALALFQACTSATSSTSGGTTSGSTTDTSDTSISFESGTSSYFQNSTLTSFGSYGFFSAYTAYVTGGTTTVDVTNSTPAGWTVTGAPTVAYKGSNALHLTSTTSSTSTGNFNGDSTGTVAGSATAVYLKLAATGTGSGLLGDLSGGTTITDSNSNLAINNSGVTVKYSAAFFVPTGSSITSMGLILQDASGNACRFPAQSLVAGTWNYITWSILGGTYSGSALTNASYTFAAGTPFVNGGSGYTANAAGATATGTMLCTSVTNTAAGAVTVPGRVAGGGGTGTLNTGDIRYAQFVPVSTTASAVTGDWFIDAISWK